MFVVVSPGKDLPASHSVSYQPNKNCLSYMKMDGKKETMNSPQPGHSEIASPMSSNVLILSDSNTASRIYVGLYAALPRALLSFPVVT